MLNARVNLIFYFLTLALSFFSRKIFLDTLGADFVGLTGTLQNLLGFLNLAELGIGSAIGYVLYKPLFDHDETKINEIISVFGYLYRWIGKIILIAGCILACFLPLIFPNTEFDLGLIFFAYFSFLASSLIGYFANYKQTLLGADQKNYVVTAYFQTATIIKTIIQMALAYYTGNYYLWVIVELSFGIIYSFILNWKINQVYPWLRSEVSQGRILFKKYPEVMKYTKQLFVHRIAALVQYQTTPFFIYSFVSLKVVAYYGNYSIIIDKLNSLVNNLLNSVNAGIGNLIAEGCNKHCTYCIIPKIRGNYRSVPMETLIEQAKQPAEQGVRELILVAQETTIYGTDLYGKKSLHLLLKELCKIPGIVWIRVLYCYPEEIYPELIETIRDEKKICHYLDLPIQRSEERRVGKECRSRWSPYH